MHSADGDLHERVTVSDTCNHIEAFAAYGMPESMMLDLIYNREQTVEVKHRRNSEVAASRTDKLFAGLTASAASFYITACCNIKPHAASGANI